ncbi:MAG TPA: MlaD family protein [Solirubrobacterales bacterium]
MKKALIATGALVVVVLLTILLVGGGDDRGYKVRAIFDSGSFLVNGEEVRVAGATVGTIESVGVTLPGELASYEDGRWKEAPGKAVLVLSIDDAGFHDFRRDATCHIRPQSLIGEKFVDCRPTRPRAPGAELPPPLKEIPDGERGAGQHLLPLEQNSTSVDPDLVNNIQRLPYSQRFRLILNELGVTLAGRGEDLEEAVKRANPLLRDVDTLIGQLDEQRNELAQLASDSEEILVPFARERASVAGFLANAGAAGEASAERGEDLEASLSKLPRFLREFRATMRNLKGFSDTATPVLAELDRAAPSLTSATRALTPFSAATTVSLKSLGASGEAAGPKLRAADPIVRTARDLARSGAVPTSELARFLVSTKRTKGFDRLVDLIYNAGGSVNEYDQYGHFLRSLVTLVDCAEYVVAPKSGCVANFTGQGAIESGVSDPAYLFRRLQELQEGLAEESGGTAAGSATSPGGSSDPSRPRRPARPAPGLDDGEEIEAGAGASSLRRGLLDPLLGR